MWLFSIFIPFTVWCVFYVLGVLSDVISTKIAFKHGLKEGNPIMNKFKDPILVSGIISLVLLILAIVAHNVVEPSTSHASIFCAVVGLYRFGCGAINTYRIRKVLKD
jgi:hypothetical protein